jgi:hypothetical protein
MSKVIEKTAEYLVTTVLPMDELHNWVMPCQMNTGHSLTLEVNDFFVR